jgi:hypothetical protein
MAFIGEKDGKYKVYLLYNNDEPIYIGMTSNIYSRIVCHKCTRKFTHYAILASFKNKQDALFTERTLIKFISFCDLSFENGKYVNYKPRKVSIEEHGIDYIRKIKEQNGKK